MHIPTMMVLVFKLWTDADRMTLRFNTEPLKSTSSKCIAPALKAPEEEFDDFYV